MKTSTIKIVSAIVFAVLFSPGVVRGRTLPVDAIGMFPKNVHEFVYVDMRQARTLRWFSQLEDQLLPPRFLHLERFLSGAGVNRDGQVEEIAWALVGTGAAGSLDIRADAGDEDVVGIALGTFKPDATQAYFKSEGLPTFVAHDFTFYGFGGGTGASDLVFGFLDANTAVFGQRREIEKLIAVRYGEEQGVYSNEGIAPLIAEANGKGSIWMVLDAPYTRAAVQQLLPMTAQFPETRPLFDILQGMTVEIDAGDKIEARFEAACASRDAAGAMTLATLLQAGMLYERQEAASSNPELAALFDSARIAYSADRIGVRFALGDDQLAGLIRRKAFAGF